MTEPGDQPCDPPLSPEEIERRKQAKREKQLLNRRRAKLAKAGVRVPDRPWTALSPSQRETRLDTAPAWHWRDIFQDELLKHPDKRVRTRAERSTQAEYLLMVRASKLGIDLTQVTVEKLQATKLEDWAAQFLQATDAETLPQPPNKPEPTLELRGRGRPKAVPRVGTFASLDRVIAAAKADTERAQATATATATATSTAETPQSESTGDFPQLEKTATDSHEQPQQAQAQTSADEGSQKQAQSEAEQRAARLADFRLVRDKLTRSGRLRLDIEALTAYALSPNLFAIGCGYEPEVWQSGILDTVAENRLGVLASRQSGKSLTIAYKTVCSCLVNGGSTALIIAPSLRQSSELLLKISGVAQVAGLRIAQQSQFQVVLADGQPGGMSRVVCLPGAEDSGNSARGYTADQLLVFEEASFLSDTVIMSVLPSIAARPKAQLVAISSAGLVGSWFHSVMTSLAHANWKRMTIPASRSGRYSREQLEELKLALGARYSVEMECRFGVQGDSLFSEEQISAAFGGTDKLDAHPELDPDSFAAHVDIDALFTAQPFGSHNADPAARFSSRVH